MTLKSLPVGELQNLCSWLERKLVARGHNHDNAKDFTQEALLRGVEANEILSLKAWLKKVAVNAGIALARKETRRDILLRSWYEVRTRQPEDSQAPELDRQEARDVVQAAICRLPALQCMVVLFWMEDWSFPKIAKQQLRPVHRVRADFKQALKTLRSALCSLRP